VVVLILGVAVEVGVVVTGTCTITVAVTGTSIIHGVCVAGTLVGVNIGGTAVIVGRGVRVAGGGVAVTTTTSGVGVAHATTNKTIALNPTNKIRFNIFHPSTFSVKSRSTFYDVFDIMCTLGVHSLLLQSMKIIFYRCLVWFEAFSYLEGFLTFLPICTFMQTGCV
jgi:hypothetical protein